MNPLSAARIGDLLTPFYPGASASLLQQLSLYLELLLRWNARTNLTAIRDPEEIVTRHFGESLFVASHLPPVTTLLDLGSGAGFPGLPIQLAFPELRVTLAEAQGKKASFLREAVRVLGTQTEVWPKRVEELPESRRFELVTLRAVDRPVQALAAARLRVVPEGYLCQIGGMKDLGPEAILIPDSTRRGMRLERLGSPQIVPRGTIPPFFA